MYELYAYPNTYALGVHVLLHEAGVQYRVINVKPGANLKPDANQATDFAAASPHQRVPALRLPDGQCLCESGAIALYLADTLHQGKYSVAADDIQRPVYLQWLFYLSSTLQPDIMMQFHPEYYLSSESTQQQLKAASMERLHTIWQILNTRYGENTWMFYNRPTAVDFCLAPVVEWCESFPQSIDQYPAIKRLQQTMASRRAYQHVLSWHQRKTTHTGNPVGES